MQALALGEQNKEVIRADKLQRLHTLHNLALLLKQGLPGSLGVAPTLRDGQLGAEAQGLREGYLAESVAKLAVADREFADSLHAMGGAPRDRGQPGELDFVYRGGLCDVCKVVMLTHMHCAQICTTTVVLHEWQS